MGNFPSACFLSTSSAAAGKEQTIKVVRLSDGQIFEYDGPVLVKDLLFGLQGLAVFHSSSLLTPLPAEVELQFGHLYYVKPWQSEKKKKHTQRVRFLLEDELASPPKLLLPEQAQPKIQFLPKQQNGSFSVKLRISKAILAEIVSREERGDALVEKLLAPLLTKDEEAAELNRGKPWMPSLESIPELTCAR